MLIWRHAPCSFRVFGSFALLRLNLNFPHVRRCPIIWHTGRGHFRLTLQNLFVLLAREAPSGNESWLGHGGNKNREKSPEGGLQVRGGGRAIQTASRSPAGAGHHVGNGPCLHLPRASHHLSFAQCKTFPSHGQSPPPRQQQAQPPILSRPHMVNVLAGTKVCGSTGEGQGVVVHGADCPSPAKRSAPPSAPPSAQVGRACFHNRTRSQTVVHAHPFHSRPHALTHRHARRRGSKRARELAEKELAYAHAYDQSKPRQVQQKADSGPVSSVGSV